MLEGLLASCVKRPCSLNNIIIFEEKSILPSIGMETDLHWVFFSIAVESSLCKDILVIHLTAKRLSVELSQGAVSAL